MLRSFRALALWSAFAATVAFANSASAVETGSITSTDACLVGLGTDDGSSVWSQLDVGPSRSVDLDLADGAGLTVACGTFAASTYQPTAIIAGPSQSADPSVKGDFGSL